MPLFCGPLYFISFHFLRLYSRGGCLLSFVSFSGDLNKQMANQSTDAPCFVVMAGLPGSGKTTLAKHLGRLLGWPIVSKDLLKSSLIRASAGMTADETGRVAYELSFTQAEDLLVHQHFSLIFDTSAHRVFILANAQRIARMAAAKMKIIYCIAPRGVRLERLKVRAAAHLHLPFMLSLESAAIEDESKHFHHLEDERLVIDTQKPLETCLHEALAYIRSNAGILGH